MKRLGSQPFTLGQLGVLSAVMVLLLSMGGCGGSDESVDSLVAEAPFANSTPVSRVAGGTVKSADGGLTVEFPPGSVTDDSLVEVTASGNLDVSADYEFKSIAPVPGTIYHIQISKGKLTGVPKAIFFIRRNNAMSGTKTLGGPTATVRSSSKLLHDPTLFSVIKCQQETIFLPAETVNNDDYGKSTIQCSAGSGELDVGIGRVTLTSAVSSDPRMIGKQDDYYRIVDSHLGLEGRIAFSFSSDNLGGRTLAVKSQGGPLAMLVVPPDSRIVGFDTIGTILSVENDSQGCSLVRYLSGYSTKTNAFLQRGSAHTLPADSCADALGGRGVFLATGVALVSKSEFILYSNGVVQRAPLRLPDSVAGLSETADNIAAAQSDPNGDVWVAGTIHARVSNRCDTRIFTATCTFIAKLDSSGVLLQFHEFDNQRMREPTLPYMMFSQVAMTLGQDGSVYVSAPLGITGISGTRVNLFKFSNAGSFVWSTVLSESWNVDPATISVDNGGQVLVGTTWGALGPSVTKPIPERGVFLYVVAPNGQEQKVYSLLTEANFPSERSRMTSIAATSPGHVSLVAPFCGDYGSIKSNATGTGNGCGAILAADFAL